MKDKRIVNTFLVFTISLNVFIYNHSFASSNEKKIKPGDVIEILVYGQEGLSRIVQVTEDGTINFPFIQNIPVDGLTLNELRDIIVVQLSKYSVEKKPIVTLKFQNIYLITVTVLGQVKKPGTYQTSQNSTIQGAIGEAGGFLPGAQLSQVQLIRHTDSTNNIITVNLEEFILQADISLLPSLNDEDVIFVPGWPGATSVKVAGEVKDPGNYEVFANLQNVLDLIFKAGGGTEKADISKVLLISKQKDTSVEKTINIEKLIKTQQYDQIPAVQPGDVIFIPRKMNLWKGFVQVMRDVTSFATLYLIFVYRKRL